MLLLMNQLSSHRFFVFGSLLTAAALGAFQLAFLGDSTHVINYYERDGCHTLLAPTTNNTVPTVIMENTTSHVSLLQRHGIQPRAFSIWKTPLFCFPPENHWRFDLRVAKSPTKEGLLFVKGQKVGSSTGSGITLRIASNVARQSGVKEICKTRFHHTRASWMGYSQRNRTTSFLWTLVRDPTARSISDFFHFVISRRGIKLTDANFIKFLQTPELVHQQLSYITLENYANKTQALNHILNDYDFIGVTERMEESAVALSMILGVKLQDVMYLSHTKSQGSLDDGRWKNTCILVQPSVISPNIRQYLNSEKWQTVIHYDKLLHQAANISLDLTIDKLGRDVFERNLQTFREMKDSVMEYCSGRVVYPCNASGVPPLPLNETDCIHGDLGCGFDCMDEYFGNIQTTMVHRQVINTTVIHKKVLNKTIIHKEVINETLLYKSDESAESIVKQAFNSSFGYLIQKCDKSLNFDRCCRNVKQGPWWFRTMMRDVPTQHVMAWWHIQSAPHVTLKGKDLQMCAIEKVGIKHWKQLFCVLQNRTERLGGSACIPNATIAEDAPKFVFLRDPLERFLSAFINKCVETGNEAYCEPVLEHVKGLDKKTLFEAYVDAFPLRWDLHFFPQSVYCNGLYRQLDSYDFVGRMGPTFYHDLERLGQQFGGSLPGALEQVFHVSGRLNSTNQGIETSASSQVLDYYTPRTLRQVLEYFAIDYELLDIPIPDWAQQMLQQQDGDESVS